MILPYLSLQENNHKMFQLVTLDHLCTERKYLNYPMFKTILDKITWARVLGTVIHRSQIKSLYKELQTFICQWKYFQ